MSEASDIDQNSPQPLIHAVDELLQERQQLLTSFCSLAAMDHNQDVAEKQHLLQVFCQLLMDYTALWQFEIHDHLMDHVERYPKVVAALKQFQPLVVQANEVALDFNDDFDASAYATDKDLEAKLSLLGESLAARMEAEDRVLSSI